jgi:hypothetical protein
LRDERQALSAVGCRLSAEQIVPFVPGPGSCIASDRITVDGRSVDYAYREAPDHDADSGWRFFAGDETQEYADEPSNFATYDVNTIASRGAVRRASACAARAVQSWRAPEEGHLTDEDVPISSGYPAAPSDRKYRVR